MDLESSSFHSMYDDIDSYYLSDDGDSDDDDDVDDVIAPAIPINVYYKILLLGELGVGKTAISFRMGEDSFEENYVITIGELLRTCWMDGFQLGKIMWEC